MCWFVYRFVHRFVHKFVHKFVDKFVQKFVQVRVSSCSQALFQDVFNLFVVKIDGTQQCEPLCFL